MDETPSFRTAYAKYLQSQHWRKRRDYAIRQALWRCQRCGTKSNLQVNHLSYDRLGDELDSDLEVLCKDCHSKYHFDEGHELAQHLLVYIRLVSSMLQTEQFHSISDFTAAVKARCVRLKLSYEKHEVERAIQVLNARLDFAQGRVVQVQPERRYEAAPIGRREAEDICRKLGLIVPLKPIPSPESFVWHQGRPWTEADEDTE